MAALEVCSLEDEVDYGIESDHDDAPAAAPASSAPPADDAEAAAPAAAAADAADDGAAGGDAAAAADAPSERKNGKAKEKPSSPRDGKDKDKKRDKDKKADAPALKTREVRRCFRDAVLDVVNGPNAPRFPFNASLVADRMRRRWPQFSAAKTEYGKFTGLVEAMAADGVVTAKASTGSGANNGGGLQITAVRARDRAPRAVAVRSPAALRVAEAQALRVAEAQALRVPSASAPRRRSASAASQAQALRVAGAAPPPKRKDRKRSPSPKRTRSASPAKNGRSDGARRSRRQRSGGRDGGGSKKPRIHFAFFTSAPPADAGLAKDILAHLEGLRDGARTMADGDGADEAPRRRPAAPEPAPEPAPPPPPAPEVDDAPPEPEAPAAPVDESAAARGPAPWPGDDSDPTKLFVGALAWQTDATALRNHFSQFSEVLDAIVMKDRDTRQSRGFGFVTLASQAAANRVLNDKHVLDGRILNVSPPQAEKTASATTEQAASAGIKKLYVANLTTRSTEQEMTDAGAFGPIHASSCATPTRASRAASASSPTRPTRPPPRPSRPSPSRSAPRARCSFAMPGT
ncbi:heterogeneous nuclear ribonucleoprotein [Aureococcus anophagefferens]|nr:heterogeneous nuclear ribonucleoprotein [Aureococcus anophagefferens]